MVEFVRFRDFARKIIFNISIVIFFQVLEKWRSDSNQSSPQTTGGSPNNNLAGTAVGTPNCGLNSSGPNSVGALPVSSKVRLL